MKIHMNIAAGYKKAELRKWFDDSPDAAIDPTARVNAIRDFVLSKYGPWLTASDITAYSIYAVTTDYFRIDFTHDSDALAFVRDIGGTIIEE